MADKAVLGAIGGAVGEEAEAGASGATIEGEPAAAPGKWDLPPGDTVDASIETRESRHRGHDHLAAHHAAVEPSAEQAAAPAHDPHHSTTAAAPPAPPAEHHHPHHGAAAAPAEHHHHHHHHEAAAPDGGGAAAPPEHHDHHHHGALGGQLQPITMIMGAPDGSAAAAPAEHHHHHRASSVGADVAPDGHHHHHHAAAHHHAAMDQQVPPPDGSQRSVEGRHTAQGKATTTEQSDAAATPAGGELKQWDFQVGEPVQLIKLAKLPAFDGKVARVIAPQDAEMK